MDNNNDKPLSQRLRVVSEWREDFQWEEWQGFPYNNDGSGKPGLMAVIDEVEALEAERDTLKASLEKIHRRSRVGA